MSSLSNANTASHPSPPEANPSQQAVEVTATSALSTSESHSQSQNTQTLVANESVADIALQESANPLVHKKPELSQFMQKGCYLDVHEYLGDWRAGIVVQVIEKHNSLQIQFDGCPSKMDEYVPMNSNRLAHFRKFTQGYTGEKYCAFRQKRTYADIEQMIAKCIQSDNVGFTTLTACEYNQEARGRYFFGVDQALQNIAYDEHQDVPISVLKIILHHVSYAIRTIANLPNTFADYWKSVANPDLQFTHLPVAISRGTYEVLQLLLHILGSFDRLVSHPNCYYARCWNTIKDQRMNILAGVPAANRNIIHIPSTDLLEQSPEQQSDAQMQDENIGVVTRTVREQVKVKVRTEIIPIISSYFWGYGGYTAILSLFEGPTEDSPDSMIPLETLFQLAKIIHNGSRGMGSAYLSPLIEKLVDYTNRRFRSLSEREIKEYDSFLVSKVRERVQECAKLHPDEEISEHLLQEIDAMDLNVAVKLLSSQYLNKKIQGLNDISEIISDLRQNHNTMNFNGNSQQSEVRLRSNSLFINNRRVNAEVFAQWIIDAKILDSLLGDSMHVEIIRRCHEIIRFLCSFGRLPLQLIEVIWNSCGADKHEAIVSAIYEMIIQIADLLDLEALNYLHAKINSIPLHEINELTLMLIRGFAQKAIDRLVPFPDFNDEMVDEQDDSTTTNSFDWIASCKHEENFFCLDLLWRILLNNDESKSVTSPITTTSISTAAITATTTTTTPKSSTKQVIPNDNLMIPEIPNNNHLSTVIVDGALGIAKEILVSQQGAHVVKKYIWMCLEEIRAGRASYQMYALMNAMAEQEFRHPSLVFLLNRSNVDLLQILIDEIRSFLGGVVKRTMSASSTTTTVPNSESAATAAPTTTGAVGAAAAAVNKPQYLATLIQNTYSIEANLQVRLLWLETILLKTDNENNRIFCITPNHFDTLWEQFVQNANHLAETQYFLQWIHSKAYPSHKQMYAQNFLHVDIMQLFSFEVIRHIFSNILCNPLRINYKKLSPELFTIFLYFFKKINLKLKNIELVHGLNNKFKVINESLQGMDAMWSIFCEAENKQVVAICCDQLSEIYLNHERNGEESFRETYMRDLTEKCMAHLSQGYDEKRSSAIERSVQLLIMFFAKFEGEELERSFKLSLSQNQYQQYSANNPVVYTFYFSPEGTKHELKLSANLPYGLLRRRISQEFKIHSSNFRIFCRQSKQYIERYQDEETPSHSRFVFNIQVLPQSTAEPFHPKNFIYQNDKYFDLLFDLLSFNQASDCHNNVWELIMKLPQNDHIKQLIVEMDRPWREILDGSFHKKLYCLNIIHELMKSQPVPQNKWLHSFVERQGYTFLYELLSEVNMEVIESALSKKFISKLLTIICFFLLPTDPSIIFGANQIPTSAVLPSACLARIVECISRICDYSLLREQTDLENSQAEKLSYAIAQANYLRSQQMQTNPIPQTAAAALAEPRQPEFFLTERDIVHSCLIILKRIYSNSLDMVFMHPLFENILRKGLARIDNSVLQKFLLQILENMFASCSDKPEVSQTLLPLVLQRVLPDIVSQSLTKGEDFYLSERTTPFFRFASTIILKSSSIIGAASTTGATVFDFNQQGRLVAEMIIRRPIVETSQSHKDDVVIGLMTLLRDIIIVHPILRATLNQEYGLVKALLNFTFEFPTSSTSSAATANLAIEANNTSAAMISESQQVAVASSSIRGPKFKSAESKKHSYELLSVLSMNCLENVNQIMQYIKPLILSGEWRTKQFKNWEIEPKKNEKSSTGYVGIKNLGCICYMNSLLQQLYMIPSFRDTILRCKDPSYETTPAEDNVLYQLKCMYTALKLSEKEAYNPKMLCNSIKDYDGQPTNVFEQMDIDEFFNSLMDKLETAMKSTIHSDAIKNHFGGVLANQIISKGCAHSSEREEEFLSLCLQVKNKKDIKQSLEALIQGEILDGDNSYHCEKCDKKVAAVKRTCLKKLPNHLILVLKRFEFNYDSMQKVKLNQFCSFPEEIDFHEFSQQGLRKADELAKNAQTTAESAATATAPTPAASNATSVEQQSASRRSKNEGQSNDNPTNSSNNQQESSESTAQNSQPADKPENYFKYRLSGIVIHMGVADSGHYYSYIGDREAKDNNVRWMEFNDNIVKPFNPKDIPNEAFGGEEKWKQQFYMQDNAMNNFRQKIRNAYLLFYDRVEMFPPEGAAAAAASTATATSKETNASTSDNNNNTTDNTGMTTNATADFSIENQSANNSSKNDEELVLKKVKSKKQSQVIEDEEEEEEEGERENLVPDDKRMVSEEEEAAACAARKKINAERGEEQELEAKYLGEFKQDLVRQNHSFHLHKILFSAEFSSFMQSLIANYPVAENATPLTFPFTLDPPSITRQLTREYSDLEFIKFSITYFLTTAIRTKIAPELLENLYLCIKQQLSLSLAASQWLLSCFTDARLVREILMSPSLSARSYITVLLAIAAEKVYTTEKGKVLEQAIEEDVPPTTYIGQFINCLLGCLPNSYNYTDYFDLLLRLLRIGGEEITTYYLNVGLIGRLMEFLYELKSKKRNSNQSEYIILPYNVPPIPLLGLPAQEGQKKISDLMLKQDSSNFNNSANLVHFWALLEKLVYLCHLPSRNPARTPSSIHYELTKDEIHQIYKDSDAVMYFMLKSEEKSSVKQMNNILAYLSYEDHLLTEYVHQVCASIVNDKQCHEFLYAFTCLKSFFRINDSISQKRIELSLNKVIQSIEANQKYQKETDVCQQFLLKILHDCPAAAVHLMKNHQNHIQLQIKLMQDYKPNKKEADENMQRSPRAELQYYDIKMPTNLQQLYNLRLWKLSQFVKLKMGTFQSLRPTFDTDDISHESQILPGKLFDYFDKQSMQWKNIRCYEVDQVRRIAKFYEIFPQLETRATNIKDEQEFYDKKGMLVYLFFSLGQHKLVPFQSMADEQSAILKPFTANGNYIEDKDESDKLTGEEAHIAQVTNASRTGGAALQDAGTNGSAEPTDGEMSSQGIIHGSAQGNDHDTDDANMMSDNPEADQYSSSNNMGELDANIDMGYQMSEEEEEEEEEDEDEDEEEEEDEDEDFNRDPTSNQTDNTDGQQQDNTAHTGGQQP